MVSGCVNDRTVEITEITAIASYNSLQNYKKVAKRRRNVHRQILFWNIAISDSKNQQRN